MLIVFHTSPSLHTKGHSGSEKKTYYIFIQNFYFSIEPIWIKILCNDCITCQLNKTFPNQKQIAEKQDFKGQNYTSITEFHFMQKDQYHHPQKETHI